MNLDLKPIAQTEKAVNSAVGIFNSHALRVKHLGGQIERYMKPYS